MRQGRVHGDEEDRSAQRIPNALRPDRQGLAAVYAHQPCYQLALCGNMDGEFNHGEEGKFMPDSSDMRYIVHTTYRYSLL